MSYTDLTEIKNGFVRGEFDFPPSIEVSGIEYRFRHGSSHSMENIITKEYKPMVVYACNEKVKDEARKHGLNTWIIFLWGWTNNKILPYDVRTTTPARAGGVITEGDDNDIGSSVEIKVTNLPNSNLLKGKTDTGADISSLHADAYNVNRSNGTVTFKCPQLSPNELTMQLVDHQAVSSSDGGTEYRPLIELNIKVNGRLVNGVLFNLNDRSNMEYPVLLGRNALVQGKFKIDPSMDESVTDNDNDNDIDWEHLQEEFRNVQPYRPLNAEAESVVDVLKNSDVSFADIIRQIRTDVTNTIDTLDD